ncbi:MAG: alpha/beta hydrolase [Prevotellaceae bacterium]|nr:alpha/beta hydrolase [Prevotellaceae bacterium]
MYFLNAIIFLSFYCNAQQKIKLWQQNPTFKQKWSELTVFLPEKPDTSGIAVIVCPGGSYYWLDMDNEGFSVAKHLNKQGIAAFVLKYRTAMRGNRHPAMIEDLQQAMQIVKANAEICKIDPEKVGIMGFSAGGHLAGTAAVYFDKRFSDVQYAANNNSEIVNCNAQIVRPYFAAMIYPVVSMEDSICHKKSRKNLLSKNYSPEAAKMMSLEQNVSQCMPPIFLLHCIGDKTVDYRNSIMMDKALTEKNVKHKFLLLDEDRRGGHGFGIQPNGKAAGWIDIFIDWLKNL